jgi:hypothetical protein
MSFFPLNCPNCGTVFNETTGVVTNGDDPEWFREIAGLPGFAWSLELAENFIHQNRIGQTQALLAATAVAAKWGGKGWKYTDVAATFRNWCLQEVRRSTNGARARY